MIEFGSDICRNLQAAAGREWLETNGMGGFASSTICGLNTRRYHALLVAATHPPVGRMVLLSKLEEDLVVSTPSRPPKGGSRDGDPPLTGERHELSTNQYRGAVHPQGYSLQTKFRPAPFPVMTFEAGGVELEKSVFMVHGENTTVIEYRLLRAPGGGDIALQLFPLMAFRDFHSLTHENSSLRGDYSNEPGLCGFQPYEGVPRLYLAHNAARVQQTGFWYRNFEYAVEGERGLDCHEDLFNPCALHFRLYPGDGIATIIASTERHKAADAAKLRENEMTRRDGVAAQSPKLQNEADRELARTLTLAADQFIVARGEHKTVIAGYPWFSDWGRDTMISLPGLTLATGRFPVARDLLRAFAQHVDQGMLPNRFPDVGEQPEYNTVDATLWFFEAVRAYVAAAGDFDFARTELYPVLADIIAWHQRGTRYGIRVDATGLLNAGEAGVQLTWMDAKIGDWVVTPRHGKPVEIQALWFNALCVMENFARRFGDSGGETTYASMAAAARASFSELFWNEAAGCLFDVVSDEGSDASIRPNQILAASLPYSMLEREAARKVVEVVERELLTPVGLRTLARTDSRYQPRYEGGVGSRDGAYHQGTVWPWLLGPFITAYVKSHGGSSAARAQAMQWMRDFAGHLSEAGIGQVSEIFDAEPPYLPRGCFAQAWSVAALLQAITELA